MLIDTSLNRLLASLDVAPHAFSVCRIQSGWRMSFPVFKAVTVHFVLRGSGHIQAGGTAPVPFAPSTVLVVPALQPHWVGEADWSAATGAAADKCELIGDGLVEFTAGNGVDDTLLLCGALSAPDQSALGLFDLMRWPVGDDLAASGVPAAIVDAMRHEVTNAGLGTQAMCQALMKQALITLLRRHWSEADGSSVLDVLHHPRLARAIAAIMEQPGADHTVGSLAVLAGMSRASFSDHFSRTFGQGPIDFVQKARLRVAARLLRVTDLPIKAIAQSIGYAGSRPFSRAFEATYCMLPSAYRLAPFPSPIGLANADGSLKVTDRPD